MKNRTLVFEIVIIALLFVFGGCSTDDSSDNSNAGQPFPGSPTGHDSGSANGYDGLVTVEITMDKGWIIDVKVDGPRESAGIGASAVQQAPAVIKEKNSVDIDTLSGATFTTNAIKKAGQEAIDKIIAAQQ
jgi:fumarate reductase flavoprotein subunit